MPGLGDLILTRRGWGHDPGGVARRLAAKSEAGSERWLACRGRGRLNNARRRAVFRLLPGEPGGGARGLAVKGPSGARSMTRAYGRGQKVHPGRGRGHGVLDRVEAGAFPWKAARGPGSFVRVGAGRIFTVEVEFGPRSLTSGYLACSGNLCRGAGRQRHLSWDGRDGARTS